MDAQTVSAWATVAAAGMAALSAWYAQQSAKRASETVEEMRAARQPAVFIDLEIPSDSPAVLVIGNSGDEAARSIEFEVDDQLPWQTNVGHPVNDLPAIREGIPYLAPGRVLRFGLRSLNWTKDTERRGWLNARIRFENADGRELETRANINLARYNAVTTDSFMPADRQIADHLREFPWLAHERAQRERSPLSNPMWCPSCLQPIRQGARKCHWCLEAVPTDGHGG